MDHPNHDLDSPAYRALNPFGQIPIIDDDGVVVSESGAILLYLARKSGKLMPHDLAGEAQLKQLDGWLTNRQFIATEDFTVADILMTHVLNAGTQQAMLKSYPNLLTYRARCTERPTWKKTVDAYCKRVEAA